MKFLRAFGLSLIILLFVSCRFDTSGTKEIAQCGNGIIETGEDCDGDSLSQVQCSDLGYTSGYLKCTNECRFDFSSCEGIPATCGNNKIDFTEECDGNTSISITCEDLNLGKGELSCTETCKFNITSCEYYTAECGDGMVTPDEECDGANLNYHTCKTLGYYGGTLSCNRSCKFDVSDCSYNGRCGDGMLQSEEGEECEQALNIPTCEYFGFYGGTVLCSNCKLDLSGCYDLPPNCGDGILQTADGEVCDASDLGNTACDDLGYFTGNLTCKDNCKEFNTEGCSYYGLAGTFLGDYAYDTVTDENGNIYVTGHTYGAFPSCTSGGGRDGFVLKFGKNGILEKAYQFGGGGDEYSNSIIYFNDNLFIGGHTNGSFGIIPNTGNTWDAFILQLTTDGTLLNTIRITTTTNDYLYALAASGDAIFAAGSTDGVLAGNYEAEGGQDAYIAKYAENGARNWVIQFGSSSKDEVKAVAVCPDGNIVMAGNTAGTLTEDDNAGSDDIFYAKISPDGNVLFLKQTGSDGADNINTVKCDSDGNIIMGGFSTGNFNGNSNEGEKDILIIKTDPDGNMLFGKLIGTDKAEEVTDLIIDNDRYVFSGNTNGDLWGLGIFGAIDAFLLTTDTDGNTLNIYEFGTPSNENAAALAKNQNDITYVAGNTEGALEGTVNSGETDIFISLIQ